MKHYKKPDQSVWAFELDGSQDDLITPDMQPISDADLYALRNPPKTPQRIQAEVVAGAQSYLDTWAKTRGYDGILSACTYASSAVPNFAAEGQAAVAARDATWDALYTVLGEVQAGTRPMPTGFADVAPLLPPLEWPL